MLPSLDVNSISSIGVENTAHQSWPRLFASLTGEPHLVQIYVDAGVVRQPILARSQAFYMQLHPAAGVGHMAQRMTAAVRAEPAATGGTGRSCPAAASRAHQAAIAA